ncbi:hypothetical protein H7992_13180 [Sporosarcina sp. resist]|uniref:hypothetical protein n=1 Tax=Sporosarcina TaxID=1569 RepID=UPI00078C9896|nr:MULTISPECIES: hypothetical protein [Sporosarcina]AMQ06516.1 hypothetical protein AZE41_11575 [Sporosarcina psychrophila]QNK86231.1 hypothetical protein H7992_13180 [Sporosarcina sp. resist]
MYRKLISKHLSTKTMVGILFLLFSCFLIVGCSQEKPEDPEKIVTPIEDKNKAVIRAVLEKVFTGPDEEYLRLSEELYKQQMDPSYEGYVGTEVAPDTEEITSYLKESYSSYFTELGFDFFVNATPALGYHSYPVDYQLSIADIEVIQSDNPIAPKEYDFTAQVEYVNEAGKTTQFEISGMAICSEEGKIGRITINDGGLLKKINEDSN